MNERKILFYSCLRQLRTIGEALNRLDYVIQKDIDRAENVEDDDVLPFPEVEVLDLHAMYEDSKAIEKALDYLSLCIDRLEDVYFK